MTPASSAARVDLTSRWLALALLAAVLAAGWLAIAAPLLAWHDERADRLAQRRVLAARMAVLAEGLPALERQASASGAGAAVSALLEPRSDAVAAAGLQARVEQLAVSAGASLASTEVLAAEPVGAYRRIRLRLTLTASWPVLVALLQALAEAKPQMLVDDVQLRAAPVVVGREAPPLDASLTVLAFRAGDAAAPAAPK